MATVREQYSEGSSEDQQQVEPSSSEYQEQEVVLEGDYSGEQLHEMDCFGEQQTEVNDSVEEPQAVNGSGEEPEEVTDWYELSEVNDSDDKAGLPETSSNEDKRLFIGGITSDIEKKDLEEYFSKFGEVTDVELKTDPNTGKSRGFGFVNFATKEAIESVLNAAKHTVKGKQIATERPKPRPTFKKIFIGGLDENLSETEVKAYFAKYGKVESVDLPVDKTRNERRQFGFVTFETEDACEASCKEPKQMIGNKECSVRKAKAPSVRGRRGATGGRPGARGNRGGYGGTQFGQSRGWEAQSYRRAYGYQDYPEHTGRYGNASYGDQNGYSNARYGNQNGYNNARYGSQSGYNNAHYGQQQQNFGMARRRGGAYMDNARRGFHPYRR